MVGGIIGPGKKGKGYYSVCTRIVVGKRDVEISYLGRIIRVVLFLRGENEEGGGDERREGTVWDAAAAAAVAQLSFKAPFFELFFASNCVL